MVHFSTYRPRHRIDGSTDRSSASVTVVAIGGAE